MSKKKLSDNHSIIPKVTADKRRQHLSNVTSIGFGLQLNNDKMLGNRATHLCQITEALVQTANHALAPTASGALAFFILDFRCSLFPTAVQVPHRT